MKITDHKTTYWTESYRPGEKHRFHNIEAVAAVGDFDVASLHANLMRFNASPWGGVERGHLQFVKCDGERIDDLNRWDIHIRLRESTLGYDDPCYVKLDNGEWQRLPEITRRKLYGEPVEFHDFLPRGRIRGWELTTKTI